MASLLLDTQAWDLTLDVFGNIAKAGDPYAIAQDAACAIRLFQGELWYDTTKGVPYWSQILGKAPPHDLLKAKFVAAAETVPGVASAKCFISGIVGRRVVGQVQIVTTSGLTATASF